MDALRAVIIDLAAVCEVANEYVSSYGLWDRIETKAIDMWNDRYPPADLHFYSDIFHDFTPEKCRFLTQKSFAELEPGASSSTRCCSTGRRPILSPLPDTNVSMLMWTEGQQFSGGELSLMLEQAGFTDIAVIPTFGYLHIVTAGNPDPKNPELEI